MIDKLQQVVDDLRIRHAALDDREQELARWYEQLTETERVAQAERLGRDNERRRVMHLIDVQLDQLHRGCMDSCLLRALRRQVEGVG
jgi:hypothetical protein